MKCGATSRVNLSKVSSSGSLVPTLWGNQPCSASQDKTFKTSRQEDHPRERSHKCELPIPFKGSNLSVQEFVLVFSLGRNSNLGMASPVHRIVLENHVKKYQEIIH